MDDSWETLAWLCSLAFLATVAGSVAGAYLVRWLRRRWLL